MAYDPCMSNAQIPAEPAEPRALSVSELTWALQDCVQTNFSGVWVAGEASDVSRPQSGHMYLTLKDGDAQLRAVIWRMTAQSLRFNIEDGMQLLCHGDIDIYPPRGSYQLIIRGVELRGEGAAQRALRLLQEKLAKEGLFDPALKRPLPKFPESVAIVTSPTGAAIRDYLEVAKRRWRGTEILVIPSRVQGVGSAEELVRGIVAANRMDREFDVLVVTRGGGSMEDLWSFNDEKLVRAIRQSQIPVVSAVGHEIDVTLSDLAADARAATPTEAAELVLPSGPDVEDALGHLQGRMVQGLQAKFQHAQLQLQALENSRALRRPEEKIQILSRQLDELDARSSRAIANRLELARRSISQSAMQLETLSPLGVLSRGYSITQREDGELVRKVDDVRAGEQLVTRLPGGKITSRVESTEGKNLQSE